MPTSFDCARKLGKVHESALGIQGMETIKLLAQQLGQLSY